MTENFVKKSSKKARNSSPQMPAKTAVTKRRDTPFVRRESEVSKNNSNKGHDNKKISAENTHAQKSNEHTTGPENKITAFIKLTRLNKPIGIYLVMWPALWSLWFAASETLPRADLIIIFILGAVIMRCAGCVINDYADRNIDGSVSRTRDRPLVTGSVSSTEALILFAVLCVLAFGLVLLTNRLTLYVACIAVLLTALYPFMKRYTYLPQVFLGVAFACAVPMAFTAQTNVLDTKWLVVFVGVIMWTIAYDTFYAMVDRREDIKIGVKSTAILFGDMDKPITACLQAMFILSMLIAGQRFEMGIAYYVSILIAAGLCVYQQRLIKYRKPEDCLKAFVNNQWVGCAIFVGILTDSLIKSFLTS